MLAVAFAASPGLRTQTLPTPATLLSRQDRWLREGSGVVGARSPSAAPVMGRPPYRHRQHRRRVSGPCTPSRAKGELPAAAMWPGAVGALRSARAVEGAPSANEAACGEGSHQRARNSPPTPLLCGPLAHALRIGEKPSHHPYRSRSQPDHPLTQRPRVRRSPKQLGIATRREYSRVEVTRRFLRIMPTRQVIRPPDPKTFIVIIGPRFRTHFTAPPLLAQLLVAAGISPDEQTRQAARVRCMQATRPKTPPNGKNVPARRIFGRRRRPPPVRREGANAHHRLTPTGDTASRRIRASDTANRQHSDPSASPPPNRSYTTDRM